MDIKQVLRQSEEFTDWLHATLHDLEVEGDMRSRFAVACFDVALEYREAIVLLVSQQMYGAAFALVRSLFEAYVRGVWLQRCASEADLALFEKDKLQKEFGTFLQDIELIEGFELGILSRLKTQGWKAMNSYTHSGFQQIIRRINSNSRRGLKCLNFRALHFELSQR